MSEANYEAFRATHENQSTVALYPFSAIYGAGRTAKMENKPMLPAHALPLSLLLAPVSAIWPLKYVRLIPFAFGVTGLCFLAALIVKETTGVVSALACFIPAALCFPALPYHFLALTEIFLFTLSAIAFWNLSSNSTGKITGCVPAILCSWLAPFVHLRGLALFGAVAAYLGFRLAKRQRSLRPVLHLAAGYLAALMALFLFNSVMHGGPLASANMSRPIWNARVFEDSFVHYRHGLLAYAPVWLLSFSGLIAALRSRREWAVPTLLFLVAVILGTSNAIGEAYPARYWVQAVPALALCLCGFSEGVALRSMKFLIYLPLGLLSLANSLLFFFYPELHLAARSGALPYDRLFEMFRFVNFGFWLDVPDSSFVRLGAVCFCALAILVAARLSVARSRLMNGIAIMVLFIGFEAHRVRPIAIVVTPETNAVVVRLAELSDIGRVPIRLRFLAPWKEVGPRPDESARPTIEVADGDRHWSAPIMSGSILFHKSAGEFSMRLKWSSSDPPGLDPAAPSADFQALACNSFLAHLW